MVCERAPFDPLTYLRWRMIRETEAFLEDALRHPSDFPRIPAVPVGTYTFPPALAARFWAEILAEHA